jgi:hypothetical protein
MPSPSPLPQYATTAPQMRRHGIDAPGRRDIEDFIRSVYRRRFDADVRQFAPVLVSLHDAQGEPLAAAGYRGAQLGPLFLERYLRAPVQRLLPAMAGQPVHRERIVEVGHLAAARAGEGRRLIGLLSLQLAGEGFEWAVSTLTQELRNLFLRMGVAPLALGAADPAVLGEQAAHWGRYYQHRPLVLAGRLDTALAALARRGIAA